MEISFEGVSAAEAGLLARELSRDLKMLGLPAKGVQIRRESSESMDLGTLLGIDLNMALEILSATGGVAAFAQSILNLVKKNGVTVNITGLGDRSATVAPSTPSLEQLEELLRRLKQPDA
ncbi:hypothetical protein GCM10007301_38420 [Azorhizobium oxalatiphilum]|uniref:Uncharacterized protein n=1 Tax=Azorhizobium oxalatiphilum TaxID=980631 RepID=A0A917C6U5_9HYPH|nr:hypothetical protein [Azorhizobium oxalatiphilum]GGF74854.1 hypothetical protein GCM10007301_38420 [Azorhizobium oxalatiphilum]